MAAEVLDIIETSYQTMDSNRQIDDVGEVIDVEPMNWRIQLEFYSRMTGITKLMAILTRLFPYCEGLQPFRTLPMRTEETIYRTATSKSDYLRKIDDSMVTLECFFHNPSVQVMGAQDWRNGLHADSRQLIVNKIMETFTRHFPFAGPEGLQELGLIAIGFEAKMYTTATSQPDYLRKICMKMLIVEREYPLQPNGGNTEQNPSGEVVNGMQTDAESEYRPGNHNPVS